jgi:ParB family chromosome partitioning protein
MSKKKTTKVLGKGLSALLDDATTDNPAAAALTTQDSPIGKIALTTLSKIEVNPFQPRVDFDEDRLKDLANSITIHGVIQPITLRVIKEGKFQLISGERRLRAAKMAGLSEIPAYIKAEVTDQESLEIALIENIQREDLNALEIALNYERLIEECKLTQEELSARVGKKRSTITNYLRLLKLPSEVQYGVKEGLLSMGHSRALIGVTDTDFVTEVVKQIIEKQLSVRQVESIVKKHNQTQLDLDLVDDEPKASKNQTILAENMGRKLTTKVQLKPKKRGKGEIIISYYSEADFKRIINILES